MFPEVGRPQAVIELSESTELADRAGPLALIRNPYCGSLKMKIGSIVIRSYEFDKMFAFWREALHYAPREPSDGSWVVLRDPAGKGPNISLQRVSERRSGKRSRLHLDLYTTDAKGEVERLIKIGAARYPWRYRPGSDFVVLEDPDGNLFCVVQMSR